jgi:hypothetical protein
MTNDISIKIGVVVGSYGLLCFVVGIAVGLYY